MLCIREGAPWETDLASKWLSLPLPAILPLTSGASFRLLHAGRSGGPQGPDIRDAVLAFPPSTESCGDVEFHIRCSDWYTHEHHRDPRYNNVILHVVLIYDSPRPIVRQDGSIVPVCSLNDISLARYPSAVVAYPCEHIMSALTAGQRARFLQEAGLARFEQKTQHFLALLRDARPHEPFSVYDACLIPKLAEALGYGRDRAFFLAAGYMLIEQATSSGIYNNSDLPEPQGRAPHPSPLDTSRLRALSTLVARWRSDSAWETIRRLLMGQAESKPALINDLRAIFSGISTARADIVICNVVLPFAAAVASAEGDQALYARARQAYQEYPALASNQVTRAMGKQLRLNREPGQACQQQGLHHIYTETCREKRCGDCLVRRWGTEA